MARSWPGSSATPTPEVDDVWIRDIQVVRYGRLAGLSVEKLLGDLVVVVGPNESGKSTLFSFLAGMLYGFYPATRDSHPHTPWEGGDIEGSIRIEFRDGSDVRVERRLLASPQGSLRFPDREEDLRNRTVPGAAHVPRDVFEQVYSLTLAELASIGERGAGGWELVQDRLLVGLGARDFHSPREAAEALEQEAGSLWRTSGRGSQAIRELDRQVAELRKRRREAAEEDRKLRRWVRELEEAESELASAREEEARLEMRIDRVDRLLPLRRRLRSIEELKALGGDRAELEGLPEDPAEKLREMEEASRELQRALDRLEDERDALSEEVGALTPEMERLLDDEDRIHRLVAAASEGGSLRHRIGAMEREVREQRRRCEQATREISTAPFEDVDEEAVLAIPLERLREDASRYRDLLLGERVRREAERLSRDRGRAAGHGESPWAVGVLGLLAVVLAVGAGVRNDPLLWIAAGASAVAAVAQWFLAGRNRDRRGRSGSTVAGDGDEAPGADGVGPDAGALEQARNRVLSHLEGIPLRADLLDGTAGDPAQSVARLVETVEGLGDRRAFLEELHRESSALRDDLEEAAARAGIDLPEETGVAGHILDEALKTARENRERVRDARRKLDAVEKERAPTEERLGQVREERRDLVARLEALGEGDAGRGASRVRERRKALAKAQALREEVEKDHPDLESDLTRIREAEARGEDWTGDDDALARDKARLKGVRSRVRELEVAREGLATRIEERSDQQTVDEIDGAIAELEETRARLVEERDRKWLLAGILREANRRFRDAHQPDVIRRAGRYLELITGGRYDRIVLSDDPDDAPVRLQESSSGRRVSPGSDGDRSKGGVSRGTRDQLYLALRLAAVDHLEASGEPLPLFMDEAFVNWDPQRRARGLDLLDEISGRRQLFVFTCHEETAAALVDLGADRIRMPLVRDHG